MLTKAQIEELKQTNLPRLYELLDFTRASHPQLLFVLENIGKMPPNFSKELLVVMFSHVHHTEIRYWIVKNLAKFSDYALAEWFESIIKGDYDSTVRREATSALGRMRDPRNITTLLQCLNDNDPNIVLQAIRGLLAFRETHPEIDNALKPLSQHANENIQDVIRKEYPTASASTRRKTANSTSYLRNTAVLGDVMDILPHVPDESIHLTFTSPPYYNARDYSIYPSYEHYLAFLKQVFSEVHRVTFEGRFCIVNTSPVIIPRTSRAHSSRRYPIPFDLHAILVGMGWEFIDDIVWVKPESSVKNRNGGFQQHRKPLGYKPNAVTEYLMVYRKKTSKLVDWNMRQYPDDVVQKSKVKDPFETSNVWKIDPTFDKVHTAVFPLELCERVIRYYSYVGDIIFDPFAGSGTLGLAAQRLERCALLAEQNETYFERMKARFGGQLFENMRFLTLSEFVEEANRHEA
jgi:DNA modification methylase